MAYWHINHVFRLIGDCSYDKAFWKYSRRFALQAHKLFGVEILWKWLLSYFTLLENLCWGCFRTFDLQALRNWYLAIWGPNNMKIAHLALINYHHSIFNLLEVLPQFFVFIMLLEALCTWGNQCWLFMVQNPFKMTHLAHAFPIYKAQQIALHHLVGWVPLGSKISL